MAAVTGSDGWVEAQRLEALAEYEVLGTPPEATFDRVVAIVAAVFDVPFAMITLVGQDTCWYKAEAGMGVNELPRVDNMCDTVIAQDEVLVIGDANAERAVDVSPLLKRGMRGYIGAPLRTREGVKIGTVCAVDTRPRTVSEREKRILADLAEIVMDELDLRLAARRMREADEQLRRVNAELEAASRNKSEFLASMSHELRTPLNGVLGAAELLADGIFGDLNAKQREYVQDIHSSGAHLLSLIDDVLDLARVESGQVALQSAVLDAGTLMERSAAFVRAVAGAKSLDLRIQPPPEPCVILADERRLTQVIGNLLSNALKFTPAGRRVTCSARREGPEVIFCVEDEGPGIAAEYHERIFDQFFRLPSDEKGTGLGLPLARRLVEIQGGRIWLNSEPGRGCRFSVALPAYDGQAG